MSPNATIVVVEQGSPPFHLRVGVGAELPDHLVHQIVTGLDGVCRVVAAPHCMQVEVNVGCDLTTAEDAILGAIRVAFGELDVIRIVEIQVLPPLADEAAIDDEEFRARMKCERHWCMPPNC